MQRDTRPPTAAQLDTVRQLIQDTGNDPEWYCVDKMHRGQVARLIDRLRDELERGKDERRYIGELIDEVWRADDGTKSNIQRFNSRKDL